MFKLQEYIHKCDKWMKNISSPWNFHHFPLQQKNKTDESNILCSSWTNYLLFSVLKPSLHRIMDHVFPIETTRKMGDLMSSKTGITRRILQNLQRALFPVSSGWNETRHGDSSAITFFRARLLRRLMSKYLNHLGRSSLQ